jgi:hypothetical protein
MKEFFFIHFNGDSIKLENVFQFCGVLHDSTGKSKLFLCTRYPTKPNFIGARENIGEQNISSKFAACLKDK